MIRVVMDTSSLVSLGMIGFLEKSLKIIEIVVPKAVVDELREINKYSDKEGKSAEEALKLVKNDRIKAVKVKGTKKINSLLSSDVNIGEAECFVCCLEEKIKTLIMDDVGAAYKLEGLAIAENIKMKISVAVLVELMKRKIITKKQAVSGIKNMVKTREWEGGVLEVLSKKYMGEL